MVGFAELLFDFVSVVGLFFYYLLLCFVCLWCNGGLIVVCYHFSVSYWLASRCIVGFLVVL